jgi:hypothetical protein
MPAVSIEELHVLPHVRTGGWLVAPPGGAAALSWHGTAGEAEFAARRYAADRSTARIYFHDRYQRVRTVTPARAVTSRARADPAAGRGPA